MTRIKSGFLIGVAIVAQPGRILMTLRGKVQTEECTLCFETMVFVGSWYKYVSWNRETNQYTHKSCAYNLKNDFGVQLTLFPSLRAEEFFARTSDR